MPRAPPPSPRDPEVEQTNLDGPPGNNGPPFLAPKVEEMYSLPIPHIHVDPESASHKPNRLQVFSFQGHKIIAAPSGRGYFCRLCGVPCGKMARANNVQTHLKNSAMHDPNRQLNE